MIIIDSKSAALFTDKHLKSELDAIYSRVPGGQCTNSTLCCSESVNCFYSEFINVVQQLDITGTVNTYATRAVRYYLTELMIPQKCPLLQVDGKCAAYDARPLPCRVFGHLPRHEYEENYAAVHEQNLAAADELKETFGIVVPDSVHSHKVAYCTAFCSDKGMTIDDRDELVDRLFMVETKFLAADLLAPDAFNQSLVQWFAYAGLGTGNARKLRIEVSRELSDTGYSATLDTVLKSL